MNQTSGTAVEKTRTSPTKLTRTLNMMISQWEKRLSPTKFSEMMQEVSQLLFRTQDQLLALPAGEARARKLHELMDTAIESVAHIQVSCVKACAACCHFEVEVTQDEAALLAQIVQSGYAIDPAHLKQQAERPPHSLEWQGGVIQDNRCVFLSSEDICGVYESRPSACRRHSVVTPAQLCANTQAEPVSRNIPIAEIILSAAMSLPESRTGSLSSMLSERLRERALDIAG